MPDYRRCRILGGTNFFTVNLLERRSDFLVKHIDSLREAVRATQRRRPFHRYVQTGIYPVDWAGNGDEDLACGERG